MTELAINFCPETLSLSSPSETNERGKNLKRKRKDGLFSNSRLSSAKQAKKDLEKKDRVEADLSWFKENILDPSFRLKKSVRKHLLSLRWVRSFGIGGPNDKFQTVHLSITVRADCEPCEDNLTEEYGEKILACVDIIPEPGTLHVTPVSSATSGDGICVTNEKHLYGTLCMFARGPSDQAYAISCYHVLYSGELARKCDVFPNIPAFAQLSKDVADPNSKTKSARYNYKSSTDWNRQCKPLGKYAFGMYDDQHDIGLVKIDSGVECNYAIEFNVEKELKDPDETRAKFFQANNLVIIKGFESKICKGKLVTCDDVVKGERESDPLLHDQVYRLEALNGGQLVRGGDSGSLVILKDKEGKLHPFGYIADNIDYKTKEGKIVGGYTIAYNLHKSLHDLGERFGVNLTPLFENP